MGLFSRRRTRPRTRAEKKDARAVQDATISHLSEFVRTRRGVEAFMEAPTSFNEPSMVLIAHDGEWTRRRVPSVSWGHTFAEHHQIPGYDAGVVGYPQRMRDWNARKRLRG